MTLNHTSAWAEKLPDFARDVRLNLSSVLAEEGAPGLSSAQILVVALASAYTAKNREFIRALSGDAKAILGAETESVVNAAKAAATIMAMNNVYYRFTHTVEDPEYQKLSARLRMNVIGKPGIPKIDFELACIAVSAINNCSACVNSHIHEARKAGLSHEAVQSVVRIAAVVNSAAQAGDLMLSD